VAVGEEFAVAEGDAVTDGDGFTPGDGEGFGVAEGVGTGFGAAIAVVAARRKRAAANGPLVFMAQVSASEEVLEITPIFAKRVNVNFQNYRQKLFTRKMSGKC